MKASMLRSTRLSSLIDKIGSRASDTDAFSSGPMRRATNSHSIQSSSHSLLHSPRLLPVKFLGSSARPACTNVSGLSTILWHLSAQRSTVHHVADHLIQRWNSFLVECEAGLCTGKAIQFFLLPPETKLMLRKGRHRGCRCRPTGLRSCSQQSDRSLRKSFPSCSQHYPEPSLVRSRTSFVDFTIKGDTYFSFRTFRRAFACH